MKKRALSVPEIGAIGVTRGLLGLGAGLLLADRLPAGTRRNLGKILVLVGLVTTPPILLALMKKPAAAAKRR